MYFYPTRPLENYQAQAIAPIELVNAKNLNLEFITLGLSLMHPPGTIIFQITLASIAFSS
ncbi:MAG: hypothetical protein ABR924_14160 [Terracidiphilus sp.]|jgi:hypothetical protein